MTHSIKTQNVDAVEVMLAYGADPNVPSRKGVAPISAAAHKGNTVIMQLLINAGAVVNAMNSTGSTALIQAAHFGHLEAVKMLLSNNAASDFANVKGTTALMRASQEGHVEIARCLIDSRVDVNRKNHEGMNALMLASQRGHADIVYVLVRAGAAMDEQTAQGSTALMLACKRGHEKCAEVLVSMGAEIFMRDKRNRTARDTATRRNHHGLLVWLDTQVQVTRIRDGRLVQRCTQLLTMRNVHIAGCLRLNSAIAYANSLFQAVKHTKVIAATASAAALVPNLPVSEPLGEEQQPLKQQAWAMMSPTVPVVPLSTALADERLLRQFTETSVSSKNAVTAVAAAGGAKTDVSMVDGGDDAGGAATAAAAAQQVPIVSTSPADALRQLGDLVDIEVRRNDLVAHMPVYRSSARLAKRVGGYSDWQWPILMQRCMGLTPGIFELIMDYLPSPRVWQWSLLRLKRRCKLAPLRAVQDLSVIMDEILCDSVIFSGRDQTNLLIKLNRSPQIHDFLLQDMCMPESLLESLCTYADTQSILQRCTESSIVFKAAFARQMLNTAVSLYRWHRARTNVLKAIGVQNPQSLAAGGALSALAGLMRLRLGGSGSSGADSGVDSADGGDQGRGSSTTADADGTVVGQDDVEDDDDEDGELMEVTDAGAEEGSDFEDDDDDDGADEGMDAEQQPHHHHNHHHPHNNHNNNNNMDMDVTYELEEGEQDDGIEQDILDDSDFDGETLVDGLNTVAP